MKINWGTGITLFIIAFMGHILFLIYKTTQESSDLQAEDYYDQEINYQARIEAISNSQDLSTKLALEQNEDAVLVRYPKEFEQMAFEGEVYFFKPDNAELDKRYPVQLVESNQLINKADLTEGWYVVKVDGESEGTPYFFEESIYINN